MIWNTIKSCFDGNRKKFLEYSYSNPNVMFPHFLQPLYNTTATTTNKKKYKMALSKSVSTPKADDDGICQRLNVFHVIVIQRYF